MSQRKIHIIAPGDVVVKLTDLHRRYIAGEAPAALGAEVGLSGNTLRNRFRDAGLRNLPRGKPPGGRRQAAVPQGAPAHIAGR